MGMLQKIAFMKSLVMAKAFRKNAPLTVIFNITDKCNLKCSYCYASYYQRQNNELSFDQVVRILDDLKSMGCKRVSFGGGEPLIRADIGDIINAVKTLGMECAINSNGYFVPVRIEALKRVDALCLSLDGDEKAHEVSRGQGSFGKVMEALECASRHHIPLHTNTVLHKDNLYAVEFVLDLAQKFNFLAEFNVAIDHLSATGRLSRHKAEDEDIKQVLRKLIRYKKEGRNILFSKKAMALTLAWPSYTTESLTASASATGFARCHAGKYFCFIDTNGDVYPCPHLMGKIASANAVEAGFKAAFEGLHSHDCHSCYQVYHNEFNLLFDLDMAVIANYTKISFLSMIQRSGLKSHA